MIPTGYIPSGPILAFRSLIGGDRMAFPPPGLFSFARYALLYYLQYLSSTRRKPLERVLLPDYMCHEVAETLRSHGYDPHFYSLEPPFDVSIVDLEKLLQQPVRWDAIVVAHFHGRVCRNLQQVASRCAERDIIVIEDAVHLPYPYAARATGTLTDATLYTLRKVYPAPHGSVIVLRDGQEEFARFVAATVPRRSRGAMADFADWSVKQLIKQCLVSVGMRYVPSYRDLSQAPLQPFNFACAPVARLLSAQDCESAVEARRRNYRLYLEHSSVLKDWGEVLDYDLGRDVPHACVVVLHEGLDTVSVIKTLMKRGVPAGMGLAVDPTVRRQLSSSHRYNRIVTLPLHQDIRPSHVRYIVEVMSRHDELVA
jgi:dTDP-4-amino-4,6-dideoxygalactose transaminase